MHYDDVCVHAADVGMHCAGVGLHCADVHVTVLLCSCTERFCVITDSALGLRCIAK